MKICPIGITNNYNYAGRICSEKYERNKLAAGADVLAPLKTDKVSFSGTWDPRVDILRKLLFHKIPDLYSDIILIPSEALKASLNGEVFSADLNSVVKLLRANKDSLFPIETQFYDLLKTQKSKSPHMSLDKYVGAIFPDYNVELLKTQQSVFDRMDSYSSELPADLLEQYNYLLYITQQKLNNKQFFLPFDLGEFKYKLGKIKERIKYSGSAEEINAINGLLSIVGTVHDVPKEVRLSKKFESKKYESKQQQMIARFRNYLDGSILRNDKDILDILKVAEDRVYKRPTKIPFNRKNFIRDIKEITAQLDDKKLAHHIEKEASSLPTSKDSLAALVVKEASRSPEQIVYDLLSGSIGSVDHFIALHNGGSESLFNYVLSSSYMNSQKAHMPFDKFAKKHPKIIKTSHRQVGRLEKLADDGVFDEIGLEKYYIENLINKLNNAFSNK